MGGELKILKKYFCVYVFWYGLDGIDCKFVVVLWFLSLRIYICVVYFV